VGKVLGPSQAAVLEARALLTTNEVYRCHQSLLVSRLPSQPSSRQVNLEGDLSHRGAQCREVAPIRSKYIDVGCPPFGVRWMKQVARSS